ncbi:hypothetical protein CLV30_106105 [Haloactinopolyspora alba]|uniref:DUF1918 domain-containing protein n=1 Tax=Haloactinopolyspora alba TaxID=648780 RepID=A0A2P8E3Q5_9ACTN|nr:hypothetical protein [Haloactinopolyspora alba]PSL04102.1 hypothetical protein CLV30_106105 [Haloactinopolyspora alba]
MVKFNIGDKVEVVSNDFEEHEPYHYLDVGTLVEVIDVDRTEVRVIDRSSRHHLVQWVLPRHIRRAGEP